MSRRKQESSDASKRGWVDRIPALVYEATADSNWRATFLSEGVQELTGYPPDRFRGPNSLHFFQLIHPDDQEQARRVLDHALAKKEPYTNEFRIIHSDGSVRYLQDRGQGFFDSRGNLRHVRGVVVDSTKSHVLHDKLKEQAETLRKLALELGTAEERVRHDVADFLHNDLQQLLVACVFKLRSSAESDILSSDLAAELMKLLNKALESSRTLISQLRPPSLTGGTLEAGLDVLSSWFKNHYGLEVAVDSQKNLTLSEPHADLLFESTRELLFNIFKHAQTNCANVSLGEKAGLLTLRVTDQGQGFDPEFLCPTNHFGLTSLEGNVQAVQGTMTVASAPGQGTSVEIKLPTQAGQREGENVHPAARGGKNLTVLLADDHLLVRQSLKPLIEQKGFDIVGEAVNGEDAVDQTLALHPDVVLMDINMPLLDGIEATRRICIECPEIQVVGLSMQEDLSTRNRMLEAGAAACCSKCEPVDQVIDAILACCGDCSV